jgi:hypothetical protein
MHWSAWNRNSRKVVFGILHKLPCYIEAGYHLLVLSMEFNTTGGSVEYVLAMVNIAYCVAG